MSSEKSTSTALAYLALLADRGIEYIFANGGTDFAPIVEAYAQGAADGMKLPQPIVATHENLAMSMAHGYTVVSGKIAAVMVHVSVGTANGICGVLNANRENVPILFTAGRTPVYEDSTLGSRDSAIHWGQEMFDQAGMLREVVKWDYELRSGRQAATVIDRAISIAMTEPKGPVYLTLPREVLAEPVPASVMKEPRRPPARPARPDEAGMEDAARLLLAARSPLVIAGNSGREVAAAEALGVFAKRFGVPVVQSRGRYLALAADNPMHVGYEPGPFLKDADLVIVLDADVPWVPKSVTLRADAKVIHVAADPHFSHIPIRGFPSDLTLTGMPLAFIQDLTRLLNGKVKTEEIERRRKSAADARAALDSKRRDVIARAKDLTPIHPAWVAHCISEAKDDDTLVFNEYTLNIDHCAFNKPGTFFASSSASGLGWGMGAALGGKLASPDKTVIATLGDGSYLFANPVTGHYASSDNNLPILTIVMNNGSWNAVRKATTMVYPEGAASRSNASLISELAGLPAFEQVCQASGGYGERVTDPAALPAAIARALKEVRGGRQALLNVICRAP